MGRRPCCDKEGLNRGAWSAAEDKVLSNYIGTHGEGKWRDLPKRAGLNRCGKSCRLRWLNYLRPDIKRGNISTEEEELIVRLHKLLGNRWSLIAGRLPGRTDNEIKNYWNTNLSKGLEQGSDKQAHHEQPPSTSSNEDNPASKCHHQVKVIRTKAFKCRKAVIPSHFDGHAQMVSKPNVVPAGSDSESPCPTAVQEQDSACGFLRDFDVNDLFISDVLKSDFDHQTQINECDDHQDLVMDGVTKIEDFLMAHDDPIIEPKDHEDVDLNALSSFLNLVDNDNQWNIIS